MRIGAAVVMLALYFFFRYRERATGDRRYETLKYVMAGLAVALAVYVIVTDR